MYVGTPIKTVFYKGHHELHFSGWERRMAEWELGGDEGARDNVSYKGIGGGREDSVT